MSSIAQYVRPDIIAQVQRLDLRARFIVEGFYAGLHSSPYHGFSVEFSEHRKYASGDDLRTIDWNVFGKTDRFYVKKFRAETNLSAHLLMDLSGSMAFPKPEHLEPGAAPRMTKFEYATTLAAALGYLMIQQQDAVGLATIGPRLGCFLPARSRRGHLVRILAELSRLEPSGTTDLAGGIIEVARRVRRRGLMVLFSDLLCDPRPVIQALHSLRFAGHDLTVFCVLDAAEARFPYRGPTRFEDAESTAFVSADADALRSAYLDALKDFLATYHDEAAAVRADFVQVDTSMTFDQALMRFMTSRRRRF